MKKITYLVMVMIASLLFSCSSEESTPTSKTDENIGNVAEIPNGSPDYTTWCNSCDDCVPTAATTCCEKPMKPIDPNGFSIFANAVSQGNTAVTDYFSSNNYSVIFSEINNYPLILQGLQNGDNRISVYVNSNMKVFYMVGEAINTDQDIINNPLYVFTEE